MYNKSGGNDVSRWKLWKNYHYLCYHLKKLWKKKKEEVMFAQRINVKENSILYGQGKTKNLHLSFKIVWWPYGATRMEKNIKSDKCCTYL